MRPLYPSSVGSVLSTLLLCGIRTVRGQQSSFVWGFNTWTSTTLPQCQSLALFVDTTKGTTTPSPPYYLIAYPSNGIPTVSAVGNDVTNLSWVVNQGAGPSLILDMVDANGNSGGVLTDVYSVAGTSTGSNASCLVSQSATLSTTTNATSQLNTCDNIQISIKNGQKPYTITVAETNTPASFNTTMGSNDDTYMWVNNLSPGQQVIVAISDAAGNYAQSPAIIKLTGNANTHCQQQSTSSNSAATSSSSSSSKTPIIAGIVVAVAFVAILGLIVYFFLVRKRKRSHKEKIWTVDGNRAPSPFEGDIRGDVPVTPYQLPPQTQLSPRFPPGATGYAPPTDGHTISDNSMVGEEMLNSGGRRESAYSGTEFGYYDNPHSSRTSSYYPSQSQSLTPTSQDPFSTMNGSKSSRYQQQQPYQYRDESPLPTGQSNSHFLPPTMPQNGSIRSYGTSGGGSTFRAVNPDHNPFGGGEMDTARLWARDVKHPDGPGPRTSGSGSVVVDGASGSEVYQHQDAGIVEEVPPAYPGFARKPSQREGQGGGGGSGSGSGQGS